MKKVLPIGILAVLALSLGSCFSFDVGGLVEAGQAADAEYQAAGNRLPQSDLPQIGYTPNSNFFTNFSISDQDYIVKIEFKSVPASVYIYNQDKSKRFPPEATNNSSNGTRVNVIGSQPSGDAASWEVDRSPRVMISVNSQAAEADLDQKPLVLLITDNKGYTDELIIPFSKL